MSDKNIFMIAASQNLLYKDVATGSSYDCIDLWKFPGQKLEAFLNKLKDSLDREKDSLFVNSPVDSEESLICELLEAIIKEKHQRNVDIARKKASKAMNAAERAKLLKAISEKETQELEGLSLSQLKGRLASNVLSNPD